MHSAKNTFQGVERKVICKSKEPIFVSQSTGVNDMCLDPPAIGFDFTGYRYRSKTKTSIWKQENNLASGFKIRRN